MVVQFVKIFPGLNYFMSTLIFTLIFGVGNGLPITICRYVNGVVQWSLAEVFGAASLGISQWENDTPFLIVSSSKGRRDEFVCDSFVESFLVRVQFLVPQLGLFQVLKDQRWPVARCFDSTRFEIHQERYQTQA